MTITAKYTDDTKTSVMARLEPGDHLASISVQAATTIPAFTENGYQQPDQEVDGRTIRGQWVDAVDHPERHIPAGEPMQVSLSCDENNPPYAALLALIAAGEAPPIADADPVLPYFQNEISRRQFYQQAEAGGYIDEDEMVEALGGKIPGVLLTKVNTFPKAERVEAKAMLAGATVFRFDNPYTAMIGALLEPPMDADALRTFWSDAAKLV